MKLLELEQRLQRASTASDVVGVVGDLAEELAVYLLVPVGESEAERMLPLLRALLKHALFREIQQTIG